MLVGRCLERGDDWTQASGRYENFTFLIRTLTKSVHLALAKIIAFLGIEGNYLEATTEIH